MDVCSPENGLQDLSDLQTEDGSTLVEELDLNFVVNKEENAKDNVYEDLERSNKLNEHRYNENSGFRSPVQTGFDCNDVMSETKFVYDQERPQSPSKDNHYQAERQEFFGSYLNESSSQLEARTLHHVIETEFSAHSGEFFSVKDASQGEAIEDGQTSPTHDEIEKDTFSETSQYELTSPEPACKQVEEEVPNSPTEQLYSSPRLHFSNNETKSKNIYQSTDSPAESRKPDMPYSGWQSPERVPEQSKSRTVGQMSVSPETSPSKHQSLRSQKPVPSQQGLQELSYSSTSHGQKQLSSPKKLDLSKNVRSGGQDSASPRGSLRGSRHVDGSSLKHVSSPQKKHFSPLNRRRRDRSVSRSPIRQRDYRNRSRSRSPYTRENHRGSPRRRYSPRRRSPPPSYHSRRGSPKRRPWSPPPNRSTGIGKPGRNLFVAGFSFLTTERDLERKFSRFGRVRDVRIVRDKRSGDSRGFGFLSLERDEEADAAIRALDKTEWNGRIVLVEKSKSH